MAPSKPTFELCDRIQARAIRRCGELLAAIEPAKGARTDLQPSRGAPTKLTRESAAKDAGLSRDQRVTALRVANVPTHEFEAAVEAKEPPTVTQLAKRGVYRAPPAPSAFGGLLVVT